MEDSEDVKIHLIEGKWYKWFWTENKKVTYGKVSISSSNSFSVSEGIHNDKYSAVNGYYFKSCQDLRLLEDLSEIQDYLPLGHPDKITQMENKRESLIEQAKREYPIGSKFYDLVHNAPFVVKSHDFDNFGDPSVLYIPVEPNNLKNKTARIYKSGTWANKITTLESKKDIPHEIIEKEEEEKVFTMEEIQQQCKEKYPIGCKFEDAIYKQEWTLQNDSYVYRIVGKTIYANNGAGLLYNDGEWAKVISLPLIEKVEDVCETCNGDGEVMIAKLYPNGHHECHETCPECNGNGIMETPKELMNTYGLKVGDLLPQEIIRKWTGIGINRYDKRWIQSYGTFSEDRKIDALKVIDGVSAFLISGTSGIWARCEGFLEFKNNFGKPKQKEITPQELLAEAKLKYPIGTKFYPAHLNQNEKYCIVTNTNFRISEEGNLIYALTNKGRLHNHINDEEPNHDNYSIYERCVYKKGKWAEIVTDSEPKNSSSSLPEKWCVRGINKKSGKLSDYNPELFELIQRSKHPFKSENIGFYERFYYFPNPIIFGYETYIPDGYTEITFEQFRTHVLKDKGNILEELGKKEKERKEEKYVAGIDPFVDGGSVYYTSSTSIKVYKKELDLKQKEESKLIDTKVDNIPTIDIEIKEKQTKFYF